MAVIPAFGRIGETREQCAERYGESLAIRKQSSVHQVGSVGIDCAYDNEGKCEQIRYQISVHLATRNDEKDLNEGQALNLLAVNSASKWQKVDNFSGGETWDGRYRTEDGRLEGIVQFGRVSIQTMAAINSELSLLSPEKIDESVKQLTSGAKGGAVLQISNPVAVLNRVLRERSNISLANGPDVRSEIAKHTRANSDAIAKAREEAAKQHDPVLKMLLEAYDMGLQIEELELAASKAPQDEKTLLQYKLVELKLKQMSLTTKADGLLK